MHWSGEIQPLSPYNFNFDPQTGGTRQIRMCTCGSTSFKLRNEAPVFLEWRYVCEGCGDTRVLKKAEPEVLARLQTENEQLRRSSQAFGELAERLSIALRTATRVNETVVSVEMSGRFTGLTAES